MRIRELQLRAYGRFTDVTLDFAADAGRISLVYGLNEAGKSTALRAISAFLFGFRGQTSDDFLHRNPDLRVGAVLERADGSSCLFVRRKGTQGTLLDDRGAVVQDELLRQFIGSLDRETFERAFGLDHKALLEGGADLLAGKGDLAESLFQGATGIVGVRDRLKALNDEADAIWAPRARAGKPLNALIEEYQKQTREAKLDAVSASTWAELDRDVRKREEDLRLTRDRQALLVTSSGRWDRVRLALPKVRVRAGLKREQAEMGDVLILPDGAARQREQAERRRDEAARGGRDAQTQVESLEKQLADLVVPGPLLALAEQIDALSERRGSHVKAMRDLPGVRAEGESLERDARELLREVRPDLALDDAESLRLSAPSRKRLIDLADTAGRLRQAHEHAAKARDNSLGEISIAERALEALPDCADPTGLRAALELAQQDVALEKRRAKVAASRDAEASQAQIDRARFPLVPPAVADLEGLPVPMPDTIDALEARLIEATRDLADLDRRIEEGRAGASQLATEIRALRTGGDVPTEGDLSRERERRDAGWRLVRSAWVDGRPDPDAERDFDPDRSLPDAYEDAVANSDATADRLRRESARVAELAVLLARETQAEDDLTRLAEARVAAQSTRSAAEQAWLTAWQPSGVDPLSPPEMRAWLRQLEGLRERRLRLRQHDAELAEMEDTIGAARRALTAAIVAVGSSPASAEVDTLAELVQRGRALLSRIEEEVAARRDAAKALEKLRGTLVSQENALVQAQRALEEWDDAWRETTGVLGLGPNPEPSTVRMVLETLTSMFARLAEALDRRKRVRGMQADADAFTEEVRAITNAAAPDLGSYPADIAVAELRNRLTQARDARTRHAGYCKQLEAERTRLAGFETEARSAASELEALIAQARVTDLPSLAEAERWSARALEIRSELAALERDLSALAGSEDMDEFIASAADATEDVVVQQLAAVRQELEAVGAHIDEANQRLAEERMKLAAIDGGSRAADAAEAAQTSLAAIRSHAERYVILRLSAEALKRAMDVLRDQNQGPVMRRAGELFSGLTAGRFQGLTLGFDKDRQVLVGRRDDGREVGVEGMSDGTRDQLYLALRLASLETRSMPEPVPVVLDDILINFDDERAKAALTALAGFAATTQVLFFTHHARMIQLADEAAVPYVRHTL